MLALAVAGVVAIAALAGSALAGPSSSGPPGMVGVPGDNVGPPDQVTMIPNSAGPPDHALENIPTHAAAWSIHADRHADDLEIEVGADERGDLQLTLRDDVNHDGRTVALARSTLEDAVGHAPATARGVHESGDEWRSPIEYQDGYASFEVPKFSSNEVTFAGSVVVSGDPAADGSQIAYDIPDLDAVNDPSLELTGAINNDSQSTSGSGSIGSASTTITPGGNMEPTDALLELGLSRPVGSTKDISDEFSSSFSFEFELPVGNLDELDRVRLSLCSDAATTYDISVTVEGTDFGTRSMSSGNLENCVAETYRNGNIDVSTYDTVTVEVSDPGTFEAGNNARGYGSHPGSATVDVNGNSYSMSNGESREISLQSGQNSLSFGDSSDDDGGINWDVSWTEYTQTEDVTIDVNGGSYTHSGVLGEGETSSIDVSLADLKEGSNTLNMTVADALSGPAGVVGLNYSHQSIDDQLVEFSGTTWHESYNVSRTWSQDLQDANLTIPFASDRVVLIDEIETRTDGGTWETLSTWDYAMDGSTVNVDLGDVAKNETTEIRAVASKIVVENGEINVLEPTIEGDTLSTKFEIVNKGDEFAIDVGGTSEGNWAHVTRNESWTSPDVQTIHDAGGSQKIVFPRASSGSRAVVEAVPFEISPNGGEVTISSLEYGAHDDIEFVTEPSSALDSVDYTVHEPTAGERYVLYSETHDVARDTGTPSSPVTLTGTGFAERLSIFIDSDDGGDGGPASSSGGSGGSSRTPTAGGISPLIVLFAAVVSVGGLGLVADRTRLPMQIVAGVGVLVALISLEAIAPGVLTDGFRSAIVMIGSGLGEVVVAIGTGLGEVAAPIALIVAIVLAYGIVRTIQARREDAATPDTQVTLDLGRFRNNDD